MVSVCTNIDEIKEIVDDPLVNPWLSEDNTNMPITFHPNITYLINDKKNCLIRVDKFNSITCCVHIAAKSETWGHNIEFVKEAIIWGFKYLPYKKFIAFIPEYNKRVISFVEKIGFKKEGVLTKSFLKNWKIQDQLIYGLVKGD